MPDDPSAATTPSEPDAQAALAALEARVRKLELENLQLRVESVLVQLRFLPLERGEAVDETQDLDAVALREQLAVLRERILDSGR